MKNVINEKRVFIGIPIGANIKPVLSIKKILPKILKI